jgi:hypothetical protein
MKKWRRLAGLKDSQLCDELDENEFTVNWTKVNADQYTFFIQHLIINIQAIAPRLERRIRVTPT